MTSKLIGIVFILDGLLAIHFTENLMFTLLVIAGAYCMIGKGVSPDD